MEVAQGVYRMGSRYVSWFLIEEAGKFTLVDAALPAYWPQLLRELSALGKSLSDIDAVVLTHNHPDHVSNAEQVRRQADCVVLIHPADRPLAHGETRPTFPPGFRSNLWRPPMIGYATHVFLNGGMRYKTVLELASLSDGEVLDVPGSPRIISTPGHTPGHCALFLERRGLLFSADALVTLDVATGRTGPCLLSVNEDREQALAALAQLEGLQAHVVLPSHGGPFVGDASEAVSLARWAERRH